MFCIGYKYSNGQRPWMEREIFGKMRHMTSNSTGKKFDSKQYIKWTDNLAQGKLF